ncbi:GTPase Era [Ureaplasma miroungigenitalium]|uniref:GTPase Era n=1 Tax=Ureaplasma miroungigenitalium TaxID=1042321 RepID=A0ABT3BMW7_9BACT|nr:GTPase Era [Ureaplasma miroungigenitalium]MCV3728590.1 GTPase Era [Ureaplasma miroungigenitalium]
MSKTEIKYANIVIIGKPNVGKSSLMNELTNSWSSIVTAKPQTTRNAISVVYEDEDSKFIFTDTPGYLNPHYKLDEFLNQEIKQAYEKAEFILFLTDMSRPLSAEDHEIVELLQSLRNKKIILVVNKAETANEQNIIDERINNLKQMISFIDTIQISALHKINIDKLIQLIKSHITPSPINEWFGQQYKQDDLFLISEIIREQCLILLDKEVPHGVGVQIENEEYQPDQQIWKITASLIVEKESHKPIIIGKGGSMIKNIRVSSVKKISSIYDACIQLHLFVKVEKNWRNSFATLNSLGYKNKKS